MISDVYNCDCLEYMRGLPDKAFELAIADPPYGINAPKMRMGAGFSGGHYTHSKRLNGGGGKLKNRVLNQSDCEWDTKPPTEDFFVELMRVCHNVIIWGGNYFPLPPSRCIVCWDKLQPWENFSQIELAWTSFDMPAKLYRQINGGATSERKIHPTQKPVELYAYLLRTFGNEGDRIFDPMMGSQSCRIAAYKMGFDFVGCELDREYFEKGCERFERECKGIVRGEDGKVWRQASLF